MIGYKNINGTVLETKTLISVKQVDIFEDSSGMDPRFCVVIKACDTRVEVFGHVQESLHVRSMIVDMIKWHVLYIT